MPPDTFPGHEEPVDLDDDPTGAPKELLDNQVGEGDPEAVEPVLDD